MADKSKILSADAEAALLKPIDEYVGKNTVTDRCTPCRRI